MATLYSLQESDSYFSDCMIPSENWRSKMTDAEKMMALEFVMRRFESLPWFREIFSG